MEVIEITLASIEAAAAGSHDPELSKQSGMVDMVWQDGEITSQKSGELLWQRNLHMLVPAVPGAAALGLTFPKKHGNNSFAFVTYDRAREIRSMIEELLGRPRDPVADAAKDLHATIHAMFEKKPSTGD